MLVIAGFHLDTEQFTAILYMHPSSQFLIHPQFVHQTHISHLTAKIFDCVKGLTEVHVVDSCSSSFVHRYSHSTAEGHWISQAQFAFGEAIVTVSNHLPVFHVLTEPGGSVP